MTTATQKITENDVKKAVTDLLDAKRIFWLRCNAGDRFGETNGRKWRIKGHEPGTADLLALPRYAAAFAAKSLGRPTVEYGFAHVPLWIEVKAPGKKQRPEQVEFQKRVEEYGCSYLIIDNIDVLIQWFKERGL